MNRYQLRARYWRIVFFFARVTAGVILWDLVLRRIGLGRMADRTSADRNRRTAARFRRLAVGMGGLMIKVGQFLSARLDVLPPEITDELAALQDEVPAESYDAIRAQAEAALGRSLGEVFVSFDERPLAAASLGQAHRARLHIDDAARSGFTDVVVKVQRPHIEQIVEVDLAALRRVGGWLSRYKPVSSRADVPALVEEFAATAREEIDYLAEGSHAEHFAEAFLDDPRVRIPRVAWEQTARRVLTLEDVSAIKLGDYDAITAAGIKRSDVAEVLVDTYLSQIFEDGVFHADPHPGNLFVRPLDEAEAATMGVAWQLTFVDFGMVGRVPDDLREGLRDAVVAIGMRDGARLVRAFSALGMLLPSADLALIERASMQAFERFGGLSMGDLKSIDHEEMMRFGLQFRELMVEMPFQLPENLLMLGRSVAILSGMCTGLDPEFDFWSTLAPYATRLVNDEGGSTFQTVVDEATKVLQTVVGLPARADRVLGMAERGELTVRTPLLELRIRRVERAVGRVASAVVFVGLIVSGALLYPHEPTLARVLMVVSAFPGLRALMGGRGRHM